jgi:hypothetical protein
MHFEQAKKVLQLTDTRIRKFGSIDISTSREIHEAIFRFQAFQRLVMYVSRTGPASCFARKRSTRLA